VRKSGSARTPGQRRVTLTDVARHATVDTSVVSRVINNDPILNIRDETRERVLASIKELGYVPNAVARSLRTARTGTLGLFLPDFVNPVYAEIISGAEAAAAERGYVLVTGSSTANGVTPQTYLDLLGQGRVDGLLLAGEAPSAGVQDALSAIGLPYLLLNRRVRGSRRFVVLDDALAARLAVQHLVGLGHTRIGHLAGPSGADTARRRRVGYLAAVKAAGLTADPELIVAADYTPAGGATAMAALLARKRPPTAVLISNFAAAIGALSAALQAGVNVPAEVSVVTIHDSSLAGYLTPPLTAVRMPLAELGRRAVDILLTRSAGDSVEEVISGPIELIVRGSTAKPTAARRRPARS
jgi:LacI family transcriptional regulator